MDLDLETWAKHRTITTTTDSLTLESVILVSRKGPTFGLFKIDRAFECRWSTRNSGCCYQTAFQEDRARFGRAQWDCQDVGLSRRIDLISNWSLADDTACNYMPHGMLATQSIGLLWTRFGGGWSQSSHAWLPLWNNQPTPQGQWAIEVFLIQALCHKRQSPNHIHGNVSKRATFSVSFFLFSVHKTNINSQSQKEREDDSLDVSSE